VEITEAHLKLDGGHSRQAAAMIGAKMRASKALDRSQVLSPAGTCRAHAWGFLCAAAGLVARDLARRSEGECERQEWRRTKAPPKHHQSRGGQGPRVQVGSLSEVCENGPSWGTIETRRAQCSERIARRVGEWGSVKVGQRARREIIGKGSSEVPRRTRHSEAPGRGGDLPLTAVLTVPEVGGGSETKRLQTRYKPGTLAGYLGVTKPYLKHDRKGTFTGASSGGADRRPQNT